MMTNNEKDCIIYCIDRLILERMREVFTCSLVRKHKILLKSVDICKIRVCGLFFCQILANIG